jgi:endonuclease/exonuclease/phosphatase (EEP) superfamily protein YafD
MFGQGNVSFIPKGKDEWLSQSRRGVLILALLAWLSFFVEGISTGLGIYRHPDSCWIAAGVAVLAALCAHASQRWWAVLALALAVGGALYGYQHNARTREWWQRFEARQHAAESSQSSTNKQVSVPNGP